jgi:hypothetical protein
MDLMLVQTLKEEQKLLRHFLYPHRHIFLHFMSSGASVELRSIGFEAGHVLCPRSVLASTLRRRYLRPRDIVRANYEGRENGCGLGQVPNLFLRGI